MPWPQDHKAQTHDRIVRAASSAFRSRGIDGVRVDEIMGRAGLTHGGFYAHFSSKDDLLQEALALASDETIETLSQRFDTIPAEQRIQAVIDIYLSPGHAAHPDRGCPLAALGPELARLQGKPRRELAYGVKKRLEWLRGLLPRRAGAKAQDQQAVGALACLVGGMVLARAVGGQESKTILAACRAFLHRALDEASRAQPRRPRRRK
jgi:TetR/AcrR family transcriptional regulator, transcriptional repressor for nem operon